MKTYNIFNTKIYCLNCNSKEEAEKLLSENNIPIAENGTDLITEIDYQEISYDNAILLFKPINLSKSDVQGEFGYDKIDMLKGPGMYILPVREYGPENITVSILLNVVHVKENKCNQCIAVRAKDGKFFDFYYNGNEKRFKPLSFYGERFVDNWNEFEFEPPTVLAGRFPINVPNTSFIEWD